MSKEYLINLITAEQLQFSSLAKLNELEKKLGCIDGKIIGTGRSDYTRDASIYDLVIDNKHFALIDIPGIEGDESKYEEIISQSLEKAHTIFYINGSGKKIEKESLEKIKKYMRNDTSVYAIFNTHCKAKKNRMEGIDATYQEELQNAYSNQSDIVKQTEIELKSFLSDNYVTSLMLNGLLAFSSLAINPNGLSTIIKENDKTLISDQEKYLLEYQNDNYSMYIDSHIEALNDAIRDKLTSFEEVIQKENIKRLRKRVDELLAKVNSLQSSEITKISEFIALYDEYIVTYESAKNDYISNLSYACEATSKSVFASIKEKLYKYIEDGSGKVKKSDIESFLEREKDVINRKIVNTFDKKMKEMRTEYEDAIHDASKRFSFDLQHSQLKFETNLKIPELLSKENNNKKQPLDTKKYIKQALKDISMFAGIALSLNAFGAPTIISLLIAGLADLFLNIIDIFASKNTRINHMKKKAEKIIDGIESSYTESLEDYIKKKGYVEAIENDFINAKFQIQSQIKELEKVSNVLKNFYLSLTANYQRLF